MKLILAIVNNDDSALASSALTDEGYSVTKLSTTGGFLMVGNTTLIIGTDDDKVQGAIDILKRYCTTRKQMERWSHIQFRSRYIEYKCKQCHRTQYCHRCMPSDYSTNQQIGTA